MSLSSDGIFRAEKVPTREFLLLYYHAEGLEMKNLVKIAARLSLRIEDLVWEITNDMDSYNTRRDHIVLLHKFRKHWEMKKREILDGRSKIVAPQTTSNYESSIEKLRQFSFQSVQTLLVEDTDFERACSCPAPYSNKLNRACNNCGYARKLTTGKLLELMHAFEELEVVKEEKVPPEEKSAHS